MARDSEDSEQHGANTQAVSQAVLVDSADSVQRSTNIDSAHLH